MLNFLTKKQKGILGAITLIGLGAILTKGFYEYSNYKTLKNIEKNLDK